jgi:hypothetical protein
VIIHVGCSGIRLQQPPACTCLHGAGEWRKHQEPLARLLALSAAWPVADIIGLLGGQEEQREYRILFLEGH